MPDKAECMKRILCFSFGILLAVLSTGPAGAKKFTTEYVSFDLLNNWHCYPEGHDWICTNKLQPKKQSEAMIILAAKQKGPMDSFDQYLKHLKASRQIKTAQKKAVKSKVYHTKQRQINNHQWIDSQHKNSEVPSYFTRYLVTLKGSIAVLVTYSAHEKYYNQYSSDFARSINSLRVKDVPRLSGRKGSIGVGSAQGYIQGLIDAGQELGEEDSAFGGDGSGGGLWDLLKRPKGIAGLLILLLAAAAYFLLKKKKTKKSYRDHERYDPRRRHRSRSRRRSSHSDRRRR